MNTIKNECDNVNTSDSKVESDRNIVLDLSSQGYSEYLGSWTRHRQRR
jgi:hypothetical protein